MKINFIFSGLFLCIIAFSQTQPAQVKKVPAKPTVSVAGKDLFRQYCAACHGVDGKGGGPAASAMKTGPSDLTQMAHRNNGKFPEEKVLRILQGQDVTAHGSQEMPVWGTVFGNMSNNLGLTQTRTHAVLQFLEDMQAK